VTSTDFPPADSTFVLSAHRVGVDGRPAGSAIEIARDAYEGQVAWNPVTNEFGVMYATIQDGASTLTFVRIGPDGTIRERMPLGRQRDESTDVAVNGRTGTFVVTWRDYAGDHVAAEISPSGRLISQGVIASRDHLSRAVHLSYNPVSGTFLAVDWVGNAVELNQHGAPLSAPILPATEFIQTIVGARPDVAEWIVLGRVWDSSLQSVVLRDQVIRTASTDGGSDLRLGGCAFRDPFENLGGGVCYNSGWLPPGMSPPGLVITGGCTTPDPFAGFGGGTCANGGWLPPGMAPPSLPPISGACGDSDPFATLGHGMCVDGGWQPPGMIAPPRLQPPCTTPDPFVSIGGGVCVNGGWKPKGGPPPH
jgi:hypothetical protein